MTKFKVPAGYLILLSFETVKEGDEFYDAIGERWVPSSNIGKKVSACSSVYRRKVPLEKGYRFLERGEEILSGDEYHSYKVGWTESKSPGSIYTNECYLVYRRKINKVDTMSDKCEVGYVFVNFGEDIEVGDEFYIDGRWRANEFMRGPLHADAFGKVRRKCTILDGVKIGERTYFVNSFGRFVVKETSLVSHLANGVYEAEQLIGLLKQYVDYYKTNGAV
jgi:hypothetical protein